MTTIRLATANDLPGIMDVEAAEFGADMATTSAIMASRIKQCNQEGIGCFWVAEEDSVISGTMILQPTNITAKTCSSWEMATDNGTLNGTFAPAGSNVYVVSLGVHAWASAITTPLLVKSSFEFWQRHGGDYLFCSRVPSFSEVNQKTGISIQDYWQEKRADGGPKDWMMHEYWSMTGKSSPVRLLENGFPPDKASNGHGVLFAANNPDLALVAIDERLSRAEKLTPVAV